MTEIHNRSNGKGSRHFHADRVQPLFVNDPSISRLSNIINHQYNPPVVLQSTHIKEALYGLGFDGLSYSISDSEEGTYFLGIPLDGADTPETVSEEDLVSRVGDYLGLNILEETIACEPDTPETNRNDLVSKITDDDELDFSYRTSEFKSFAKKFDNPLCYFIGALIVGRCIYELIEPLIGQ